MANKDFIPAAHCHFLTKFYDPFARIFLDKTHQKIIDTIDWQNSHSVLDIGCGPGNFLLKIHSHYPTLQLIGVDIDPEILAVARQKLKTLTEISLLEDSAVSLPFKHNQFDIITSTLAFHHLTTEERKQAFQEAYRVLKQGGTFWLYEFANPVNRPARILASFIKLFEDINDGINNKLPLMYQQAGFRNIRTHWTKWGLLSLLSGQK